MSHFGSSVGGNRHILMIGDWISMFGFSFIIASDAKKCRAYGRGIQPKGVRTGDVAEFRVITKDAGEGAMKATVTGPGKLVLIRLIDL